MYRPDEMAMILEQVRQEVRKNQLANKEREVFVYDGNYEDKPHFPTKNGYILLKISEKFLDITRDNVKKLMVYTQDEGEVDTIEIVDFISAEKSMSIYLENAAYPLVVAFAAPDIYEPGTYFCVYTELGVWPTKLELETIHPIPAEYIPPLDRLILNGADGNQYALTITDGAISVAPVTT